MADFAYKGLNSAGRSVRGRLAAEHAMEARSVLRQDGIVVFDLRLLRGTRRTARLTPASLLRLTQQLAQLTRAGCPLFESVRSIEERSKGTPYQPLLREIRMAMSQGAPFSQALGLHPEQFDGLFRSMISAGEASGSLGDSLERLEELLTKQIHLRSQLRKAFTYPIIVLLAALGIVVFLLLVAVPSLEPLLEGRRIEGVTWVLLQASHVVQDYGILIAASIAGGSLALFSWSRSLHGRQTIRNAACHLPLVGNMLVTSALARTFRTMASLLRGGVSLLETLRMSRAISVLPSLQAAMSRMEEGLIQGGRFSQLLSRESIFPPLVVTMVGLAEESGELSGSLTQLAKLFEEEANERLDKLQQWMQPVILVFLGLVVGLVLIGILVPLTDVNQLVGGSNG
ncbi:MAG: type II secretion system F family protein [Chlamydiia bacterium]